MLAILGLNYPADHFLSRAVQSNVQKLGQMLGIDITTKTGFGSSTHSGLNHHDLELTLIVEFFLPLRLTAFVGYGAVFFFLCVAGILRGFFLKRKAADDEEKKKPKPNFEVKAKYNFGSAYHSFFAWVQPKVTLTYKPK
jgi:hypothetical protein